MLRIGRLLLYKGMSCWFQRKEQAMSELLYNKSKAVEELNKVEGFYPLELARVKYRILKNLR